MTRREIPMEYFYMGPILEEDDKCAILHRYLQDFFWGYFSPATETKANLYFIYDFYNT